MIQVLTDAHRSPLLWHEGDGPCLELGTINAAQLTQTVGVYSRFGGSHLGPMYFYWLAPFYVVLGRSVSAMSVGVLALHLSSVVLLLAVLLAVLRRHGCRMIFVAALLLVVYLRLIPLDSIWNPNVLALPFCLFLYAAGLLGAGYLAAMPLLVLTGSFLIQTHFATAPSLACVASTSMILLAWNRAKSVEQSRSSLARWVGVSAFVAIIVWLPPVLEELHNSPGNLRLFVRYVRSSSAEMAWIESASILARKVSWVPATAKASGVSVPTDLIEGLSWVLTLLQLGGAVAICYSGYACIYCRSLAIVAAVGILSGLVTVANIRMGAYDPLTDWMSAIGLVGYSLVLTACIPPLLRPRRSGVLTAKRGPVYTKGMNYILPGLLAILAVGVTITTIYNSFFWAGEVTPRGSLRVRDLSNDLMGYLEQSRFRRPQILADPDRLKWRLTTGISLELIKANRGFSPRVSRLGAESRPSRDDDAVVLISERPCSNEMCVAIARDMGWQSGESVARRDGDTFMSSLVVPPRISAGRLADSLGELFGSPPQRLPSSLAERVWMLLMSANVEGELAYSISRGSRRDRLEPLQQVSLSAFPGGLSIVANGYSPRTVTPFLDLRRDGLYFLLMDLSLDHDDGGRVFYGRPSQEFSVEDSTAVTLFKGRNLVSIPLPFPGTVERIRFDPGHRPGSYTLSDFSIVRLSADTVLGK